MAETHSNLHDRPGCRIERQETMLESIPLSESVRNLIAGSCDFAVIGLVLLALGSILLFMKVFKADFSQD